MLRQCCAQLRNLGKGTPAHATHPGIKGGWRRQLAWAGGVARALTLLLVLASGAGVGLGERVGWVWRMRGRGKSGGPGVCGRGALLMECVAGLGVVLPLRLHSARASLPRRTACLKRCVRQRRGSLCVRPPEGGRQGAAYLFIGGGQAWRVVCGVALAVVRVGLLWRERGRGGCGGASVCVGVAMGRRRRWRGRYH
jgi:hypothetical protein